MRALRRLLPLLLASAIACDRTSVDSADRHAARAAARHIAPLPTDTIWTRGGRSSDYVLKYPEYLAHDGERVYVTDNVAHQVLAFNQSDGALAWSTAGTNAGIRSPNVITGLPAGGIAVLDGPTSVVVLDTAGRRRFDFPLIDGEARAICAMSDSTYLVAFRRERLPLVLVDTTGRALKRFELPWPAARRMSAMQTQLILSGGSPGRCIAALAYGEGMASVREDGVEWTTPYAEAIALPGLDTQVTSTAGAVATSYRIDAKRVAARDVTADDSIVSVAFEGASGDRGRLIDEFDAHTGAYRGTRLAGHRVVGVQMHAGRGFFLLGLQGYPALVALSLTPR